MLLAVVAQALGLPGHGRSAEAIAYATLEGDRWLRAISYFFEGEFEEADDISP